MSDQFEQEYGTEEICPQNNGGPHEVDVTSASTESDGGTVYVDITCKHCGRSGCIGKLSDIAKNVSW